MIEPTTRMRDSSTAAIAIGGKSIILELTSWFNFTEWKDWKRLRAG